MKNIEKFIDTSDINYHNLPYSGEHESEHNLSHKKEYLRLAMASIKELATICDGIAVNVSENMSGSIDRGSASGFITSKDGTKTVYVSTSDGIGGILLFRTAEHAKDYSGGSNNTEMITVEGFERAVKFIKRIINN